MHKYKASTTSTGACIVERSLVSLRLVLWNRAITSTAVTTVINDTSPCDYKGSGFRFHVTLPGLSKPKMPVAKFELPVAWDEPPEMSRLGSGTVHASPNVAASHLLGNYLT